MTTHPLSSPPPLDENFLPAETYLKNYFSSAEKKSHQTILAITIYRNDAFVHTASLKICPQWEATHNFFTAERMFKTCLWIFGGDTFFVDGCPGLSEFLEKKYSSIGDRNFDAGLIGTKVFGRPLTFLKKKISSPQYPTQRKKLDSSGNRIGLDLGGSDIKLVSIREGTLIHAEEISWDPYRQSDSQWHVQQILAALKKAAQYLPTVDSIGMSIPGILVNDDIKISALFQNVPYEEFCNWMINIQSNMQERWPNIPVYFCNDGDAAALFGGIGKKSRNLLALSLGTSVAGGFVSNELQIPGWFNELAFIPIDFCQQSIKDPWSSDIGCAASYLSQQAVFRLALQENLLSPYQENTKKLEWIQEQFSLGDPKSVNIFKTIGIYLGYTIAYLFRWYQMDSILLLGRVCSRQSGEFLITVAKKTLLKEFPQIHEKLHWEIPKEESQKRMSQAIAAASLSGTS